MLEIRKITNEDTFVGTTRTELVDFLYTHLGGFGDPKNEIEQCLDYAFSQEKFAGGFALAAFENERLVGALIMNRTGMADFIPGWILVYIAVADHCRGKGYGRKIIEESFAQCDGDVKLHVEYDNPAKRLYERIGFQTKYAEMRYRKKEGGGSHG